METFITSDTTLDDLKKFWPPGDPEDHEELMLRYEQLGSILARFPHLAEAFLQEAGIYDIRGNIIGDLS